MSHRHYAGVCNAPYLPRLRVLAASMRRHCTPFTLHVLAWDDETFAAARTLGTDAVALEQFLGEHPDLRAARLPGPPRTAVEHMWTARTAFLADVIERSGAPATQIDADVMFWSRPDELYDEMTGPAAVLPHALPRASAGLPGVTLETHAQFGAYNAGLVYVADLAIARRWAEQTRAWCYARVEEIGGRTLYADQGYLDAWPAEHGAHVIANPAACPGPWSAHTQPLEVRDGVVHFGGRPLIAWHYSSFRLGVQLADPGYGLTEWHEEVLYGAYRRAWAAINDSALVEPCEAVAPGEATITT